MNRSVWVDLEASPELSLATDADICIIGAGAAGIYLATQLARRGDSVVLIEAGPASCVDGDAAGFDAEFEAAHYPGATAGRFFGVGGSTSRWGGALVPHTDHDLREVPGATDPWAKIVSIVAERAPRVLRQLGYWPGSDFVTIADRLLGQTAHDLHAGGIHTQAVLHLPFRRKNLVGLLDDSSLRASASEVFFNAVAKTWLLEGENTTAARIRGVVAVSRNHRALTVRAKRFVIAGGAIESARILLELDESASRPIIRRTAATGCYLADHLSVPIADVLPESLEKAAALFSPRFAGAWMRSFRFLEASPPAHASRAFAHFLFSNVSPGIVVAKEVLSAIQGRRMPSIRAASLGASIGDLVRMAYDRFANSRLYIPPGTRAHLQLDMEQTPARDNHVRLGSNRDVYGRRMVSIHWRLVEDDLARIAATARRFLAKWADAGDGLPQMCARVEGADGYKPYDAYHPVGTCRMGTDPEAVVDLDLKVWGVQNVWVTSTGVLPSAGTANPTLTMLCLTDRLAEHLEALR